MHTSSLYRLNKILYQLIPEFKDTFKENLDRLNTINDNNFSKNQRIDRNNIYSHSGASRDLNFNFKPLLEIDIQNGFDLLRELFSIAKKCLGFDGHRGVMIPIPFNDNQTETFIDSHLKYEKYYLDHIEDAFLNGY